MRFTGARTLGKRPIEVVHLIGCLDVGGAETVALDLCRAIPPDKVHQTFVCLAGRRGDLADEFEAAGARVLPLRLGHPLILLRLVRLLRGRPGTDVLVSHVSLASGLFLSMGAVLGVPIRIARFHSQDDGKGSRGVRRLYRFIMRLLVALSATHVLGVTESSLRFGLADLRRLAEKTGCLVGVVPNGVDTRAFEPTLRPLPSSPFIAVHVGRASPEKNRVLLAPILRSLEKGGPSQLRVVGSWDRTDLGPGADNLSVIGPTRDVAAQLNRGHSLVLPSVWEGLPTVVLEALSCDVAVVASNLPGLAEIARQTEGVILVPLGSSADDWAAALRRAATLTGHGRIRQAFLNSPFTLDRSAEVWTRVWTRAPWDADDLVHPVQRDR